MFDGADRNPVLIKEKSLEVELFKVGTNEQVAQNQFVKIKRLSNKEITIDADLAHKSTIYDINGRILLNSNHPAGQYTMELPSESGVYFIRFMNEKGGIQTEKVLHY
jgi:hypothetical protein